MYLRDILIENVGPISKLDLTLPFETDGSPKPVILVGANGSGKTILQAHIADALILMATPHFQDVAPQMGLGRAYFKIIGSTNQRVGTPFGLSLLTFEHRGKRGVYVDKTGTLSHAAIATSLTPRFPGVRWSDEENHKQFVGFSKDEVVGICTKSALCFFPSTRRELPHWLNVEAVNERRDVDPSVTDAMRIQGRLSKPVFVERCREQNKRWILDVLFDSRVEIRKEGEKVVTEPYERVQDRLFLTTARQNVDTILRSVLDIPDARIHANYRTAGSRLAVARGADIILPSLDNLSLGQSLLFNLFVTIVRYADSEDLHKAHSLDKIEGIVIIDEVDAHLHADLQFTSLPKLVRLLPKVQFILTTHAPLCMLGMEREFGADHIAIFELPNGQAISTERFSEFKRSLDFYRETKAFEAAVRDFVNASTQPTVLVEGETDRDYLEACLRVLNISDLESALRIEWVGNNIAGQAHRGGKDALDIVAKTFKANPDLLQRKLLLLYDCDTGNRSEDFAGKLFVRTIPANPTNAKFRRGMENLLPESLARDEFYDDRVDEKYGGRIQTLNKRRLCDWVIAQTDPAIFAGFTRVLEILRQFDSAAAVQSDP